MAEDVDLRALLAAHTAAEEARLGRIETALETLASRASSPPDRADREVGRAWRYAAIVAAVVVGIVFCAFQVSAAVDGRIERGVARGATLVEADVRLRNADVAHQLELARREESERGHELAKALTAIEERLVRLEHQR